MPAVIGMSGEDGEAAIELFDEHDACEFVRQRHLAEREFHLRA